MKTGKLCTKEDTLKELCLQLESTLKGAPPRAANKASASGVKDRYHLPFFNQLQDAVVRSRIVMTRQSQTT
jgi:hypothetical protein